MPTAVSPAAIIVSCDERYAFLLRGLILSLAEFGLPKSNLRIILIDIGCSQEMVAWLRGRDVDVIPFSASIIPKAVMDVIKPSQWAQVLRPWLPDIVPDCETLIWIDADIWFQTDEAFRLIETALLAAPESIVICPGVSHYGTLLYERLEFLKNMHMQWYGACCPPELVATLADRMHFSSGLFGMRRTNAVWKEWKRQIEHVYPIAVSRNINVIHLAEQTALNIILLMNPHIIIKLDPLLNFHCNGGGCFRDFDGKVKTSLMIPHREISAVHLANWSLLKDHYISSNLLYQAGNYLSHKEWTSIRSEVC